ncbi:MAG: glycosyltransferase family 4 protein [Sodaliphilus sp.]|nr:glycosyltransferase family 4 protein [Sodaliphilus sp.]
MKQQPQSQPNILFLATEYEGGMRPYAYTIIHNTWNEHSHAVVVIKDEKYKRDFHNLDPERVHFITYPKCKLGKLWFKIQPTALITEIKRILKEVHIDVVYSLTGELVLSDFIKPLQKKVPVLYTVHDAIPHETKLPLIEKLKERYIVLKPQQKLLSRTMHKVTNSKAQFEYVSKHYTNSKNIFYAPFPSLINDDIKNGKTEVPETKGVTNYILFFGNIHLYKGVDLLYRCYLENSELHKHKLVLAGNGIYYFPRPTSKEGVIVINRFVDDKELADLFQKAAVVVYPYISATQSGVISIASFFKKPIVLSDVDYFKEVAENQPGVTFFKKGDTNHLARAIKDALATQVSSERIFTDIYSPESLTKSTAAIIHQLIEQPK